MALYDACPHCCMCRCGRLVSLLVRASLLAVTLAQACLPLPGHPSNQTICTNDSSGWGVKGRRLRGVARGGWRARCWGWALVDQEHKQHTYSYSYDLEPQDFCRHRTSTHTTQIVDRCVVRVLNCYFDTTTVKRTAWYPVCCDRTTAQNVALPTCG